MEQTEEIIMNGTIYDFKEILYWDGIKISLNTKKSKLLVWYDNFDEYNEYFLIDCIQVEEELNDYLSNRISLYELFDVSSVYSVKRYHGIYNLIRDITYLTEELKDNYELPDEDSYLGGVL